MRAAEINVRTGQVVNAAMKVHTIRGPGLWERIDLAYRLDLVVDDVVVVELKAVTKMLALYEAQLLSYRKSGKYPVGLLINFHSPRLKDGIKRLLSVPL